MKIKALKSIYHSVCNYIMYNIDNKTIIRGGNKVLCARNVRIRKSFFMISGRDNKIIFQDNVNVNGLRILIVGNNNLIQFGESTVVNASKIQPTTINVIGGKKIIIGKGCLFSNNIEIHTSDYHKIFNQIKGNLLNPDKDIIIGNNVWIGLGATILKGTHIADNTIVGAKSLCSGKYNIENTVLAGNPAKVIKDNVIWEN